MQRYKLNKNVEGEVIDYLGPSKYNELKGTIRKALKENFSFEEPLTPEYIAEAVLQILREKNFLVAKKIIV